MFTPDYFKFFDNSRNLLCVIDKDGILLAVNKAFERIFGYSADELISQPFFSYIHSESVENAYKIFENLSPGKFSSDFQFRCRCKDGKYKNILWNLTLDIENGNCYASGADITKLKQQEELLDDAMHIAKIGAWELEIATKKIIRTKETFNIYELEPGESLTLEKALDFFHPEDKPVLHKALEEAATQKKQYNLQLRFRTAKNKDIWVGCIGRPIVENDKVVRIQGTFQDITHQKKTELLLQDREAHLKAITDFSPLGILVTDAAGNCTYANEAYFSISGLTLSEAQGNGWHKVIHPDDGSVLMNDWISAAQNSEKFNSTVRYINAIDERIIWVGGLAAPFFYNGQLKGYVAMVEDITDKKNTARQIEDNERRLKEANRIARLSSWEADLLTNKVTLSEESARLFGFEYTDGVISYEDYIKRIHPEDATKVIQLAEESVINGRPYEAEMRNILPTGEIRYTLARGVPVLKMAKW